MGRRGASREFVGREDDLADLRRAFDLAGGGEPAMVLVTGEAGIGKTRLVRQFLDQAAEPTIIATGACVPIDDGGLPYAPVVGILRSLARQLDDEAAAGPTAALEALLPSLGATADEPLPSDPNARRGGLADTMAKLRLFDSITSCLTEVAAREPLIVLIEDLHWADSTSVELLHFLTRNLADARVLIIGTCRLTELSGDDPLRGRLSEISRHEMVSHLEVGGLEREQTARLIEDLIGHPPDWALVDGVWSRSQGNPFFVEELTATRHSQALSDGLLDVVRSSVERLAPEAQQVLQIVAACGQGADHRLTAAVSPLEADDLDRALADVVDRHILIVDPDEGTYGFRHALLREAVYASILPNERERLHRRLAVALTADATLGPTEPGRRSSELAQHWWAARAWGEAHDASVESARTALLVRAFPEAYGHLVRALDAVGRMPAEEAPDRIALLEETAELAGLVGEGARSVELATELVDLIDPVADPLHAARALTVLGRNTWNSGDAGAVLDAYARARALLPSDPPTLELAMVLAEEGGILMVTSRLVEGEQRCRESIEIARAVGARQVEGKALNTLGCCRSLLGFADEGIEQLRESLAIAHELQHADDLNRAYGNLGGCLLDAGRLEEAGALVYESVEVAQGIWGMGLEMAVTNSAEALIRLGRYDEATGLLDNLGDRALGSCESGPPMQRVALEIRRGDLDAAERYRLELDELTASFSDVQLRGSFHLLSAELAAERGRPQEADAEIEAALALAATTDDHQFSLQMCSVGARALADQFVHGRSDGRPVDRAKLQLRGEAMADEAVRLLAACADRGGDVTAHLRGLATTAAAERSRMDQPDPAPWAEAALQWELAGERYDLAYCLWRQAEAHLAGRSDRSAAECLRPAVEISREIGARRLTDEIEALARRARIALFDAEAAVDRSATVGSDLGLTPREVEVLALLAVGSTDREIADQLFISKKTSSVHVSNLIRKLGVVNRVEAGRLGQAHLAALESS